MAAGVQAAGTLSSMLSFRDSGWAPWLVASYINALSPVLLFLSCLIVTFGYESGQPAEKEEPDTGSGESSSDPSHCLSQEISVDDHEFEDVELDDDKEQDVELGDDDEEQKMTAEELLGTNDPIIFQAVAQGAMAIREFAVAKQERGGSASGRRRFFFHRLSGRLMIDRA
jgi:hypothetical protein